MVGVLEMSELRTYMNLEELRNLMPKLDGKTIVTTNGCFDLLHYGHLKTFQLAKELGDILLVGINSDGYIRAHKGEGRPINNELIRAYNLSRIRDINGVVLFHEDTPNEFLKIVKPRYHVKSRSGYKGPEESVLKQWGGKLVITDDIPGYSTTNILNETRRIS
jgi:rfaE bifunctional protein nucleotidyltransferase chain/domain